MKYPYHFLTVAITIKFSKFMLQFILNEKKILQVFITYHMQMLLKLQSDAKWLFQCWIVSNKNQTLNMTKPFNV